VTKEVRLLVIIFTGALFFFAGPVVPVSADEFKQALQDAYDTNPNRFAAQASLNAANEGVSEALGGWRPTVSLSASLGAASDRFKTSGGTLDEDRNPLKGSLNVTQPIYSGGETTSLINRADAGVRGARANLEGVYQDIFLRAAGAYIGLYGDQKLLEISKETVDALKKQLQIVRERYAINDVTNSDLFVAEGRLARANDELAVAAANVKVSAALFEQVIGRKPRGILLEPKLPLKAPESLSAALAEVKGNLRVKAAIEAVNVAEAEIGVFKSRMLPKLNLRGALRHENEADRSGVDRDTGEILLELTVPLYQGGRVSSQVRAKKYILAQRRSEVDVALRDISNRIRTYWSNLQSARQRLNWLEIEVAATTRSLRGIEAEA
jgi:outer membrane protein